MKRFLLALTLTGCAAAPPEGADYDEWYAAHEQCMKEAFRRHNGLTSHMRDIMMYRCDKIADEAVTQPTGDPDA